LNDWQKQENEITHKMTETAFYAGKKDK